MPASVTVEEIHGPYGPVVVSELVLQRIWARGEFLQEGLLTRDGLPLVVEFPGVWNRTGGPDFRGARLRLNDRLVEGDVEIHFREEDWFLHRHHQDPAYNRVCLHVVLFPSGGRGEIPEGHRPDSVLLWLPYLERDLESYADETAFLLGPAVEDQLLEDLAAFEIPGRIDRLRAWADQRWVRKRGYAETRLRRLGFEAACHEAVLEGLGLVANRGPMIRTAARFAPDWWTRGNPVDRAGDALAAESGWKIGGVRPAGHPRRGLEQYATLCQAKPDWKERLAGLTAPLSSSATALGQGRMTRKSRAEAKLPDLDRSLAAIFGTAIGPARRQILVCDMILPLLAIMSGTDFGRVWSCWYAGDFPTRHRRALGKTGIGPLDNGLVQGWIEGLAATAAPAAPTAPA